MKFFSDLGIIRRLILGSPGTATHACRMEGFYRGQASTYDAFRRRLLHGREALFRRLTAPEGGVWVDMGGGTASNLETLGPRIARLGAIYVVDLSPSLLAVARRRIEGNGWSRVHVVQADAASWRPPRGQADVVTFSYSLTMIPDWFAALENARAMLKPGGMIGVVDFHVSRKYPPSGFARQGWAARSLWPLFFARADVFLSADHVPFLHRMFEPIVFSEHKNRLPYFPFRAAYYIFIGWATSK